MTKDQGTNTTAEREQCRSRDVPATLHGELDAEALKVLSSIAEAIGTLSQLAAVHITASQEDEIRREVASWLASHRLPHLREPEPLSWTHAVLNGLGSLIDFFPESQYVNLLGLTFEHEDEEEGRLSHWPLATKSGRLDERRRVS